VRFAFSYFHCRFISLNFVPNLRSTSCFRYRDDLLTETGNTPANALSNATAAEASAAGTIFANMRRQFTAKKKPQAVLLQ
jgi:hypothetical protein